MGEEKPIEIDTQNANQSEMVSERTKKAETPSEGTLDQMNNEESVCGEESNTDVVSVSDDVNAANSDRTDDSGTESKDSTEITEADKGDTSEDSYLGCFTVQQNPDDEFDIKVGVIPNSEVKPTKEQIKLYNEQEAACSIIKSLDNTDTAIKKKYFSKLLTLTQAGLVGISPETELALDSLERLKEEIVIVEGKTIKNRYMARLGLYAGIGIVVFAILCAVFTYCCACQTLRAISFLGIGTMIGTWVSFGARKFEMKFEELSVIEKDMMEPVIRLVFIFLSAVIFLFFMITGIIEIKVGSLDTKEILNDYRVPLIIGVVCGLVESKIGIKVHKKATTIIGE